MTSHKNAEVLIALAEGKQIEWSLDGASWEVYTEAHRINPVFQNAVQWRVYTTTQIPVDTPIWVRDRASDVWLPRHATGQPGHAWAEGCTSHTTDGATSYWGYITTVNPETSNPPSSPVSLDTIKNPSES